MTNLLRDFRFAFRLLWQNRSFTAIAVLALALGVGPNTAIFSVLYATLYAPMPYPKSDQLVMIWSKLQGNRNAIAAGDFLDWQKQSTSFQGVWAWSGFDANLGGPEGPEQVSGTQSTPGQLTGWEFRRYSGAISGRRRTSPARTTWWSSPIACGSAVSAASAISSARPFA